MSDIPTNPVLQLLVRLLQFLQHENAVREAAFPFREVDDAIDRHVKEPFLLALDCQRVLGGSTSIEQLLAHMRPPRRWTEQVLAAIDAVVPANATDAEDDPVGRGFLQAIASAKTAVRIVGGQAVDPGRELVDEPPLTDDELAMNAAMSSDLYHEIETARGGGPGNVDALIRRHNAHNRLRRRLEALEANRQLLVGDRVEIPVRAIMWLLGAGPGHEGQWFGDAMPNRARAYWWRPFFLHEAGVSYAALAAAAARGVERADQRPEPAPAAPDDGLEPTGMPTGGQSL